jgi:hypothetical protein
MGAFNLISAYNKLNVSLPRYTSHWDDGMCLGPMQENHPDIIKASGEETRT